MEIKSTNYIVWEYQSNRKETKDDLISRNRLTMVQRTYLSYLKQKNDSPINKNLFITQNLSIEGGFFALQRLIYIDIVMATIKIYSLSKQSKIT